MGTIVFVEVDPLTGATKITSDHPVTVTSNDANVAGSAVASNMEQVTILPGQAPSQPQQISRTALANLGGCLVDFHSLALSVDRNAANERTQDRMAIGDGELLTLSVALEPPTSNVGDPGDSLDNPDLDPFDPNKGRESSSGDGGDNGDNGNGDDYDLPGPCDGLPCDGGFPPYLPVD